MKAKRNQTRNVAPDRRMIGGFPYCDVVVIYLRFRAAFRQRSACQQEVDTLVRYPRNLLSGNLHENLSIVCGFASRNVSTNPHFSNRTTSIHAPPAGRAFTGTQPARLRFSSPMPISQIGRADIHVAIINTGLSRAVPVSKNGFASSQGKRTFAKTSTDDPGFPPAGNSR